MLTNPNTLGLFDPNIAEIARDRPRRRRDALLRRRQPQRRDGPLAARRHGLRHRPLQPAQVLHPAARRRRPGLGADRGLRAHRAVPAACRCVARGEDGALRPRLDDDAAEVDRAPARLPGQLRLLRALLRLHLLARRRRPAGRLRDGRAERQLPARPAARAGRRASTCRSPTASCACTSSCSPAAR